jgi:hypothetical protein
MSNSQPFDLEELLEGANDPRRILGIFSYCDNRCERCSFRERCGLFHDLRRSQATDKMQPVVERLRDKVARTAFLVQAWCERAGIDLDRFQREIDPGAAAERTRKVEEARRDPLQQLAESYTRAGHALMRALHTTPAEGAWTDELVDAVDTISWLLLPISSKLHRAICGFATRDPAEEHPVQNDWNGSAKMARLHVAASKAAWQTLLAAGQAGEGAGIQGVIDLLERLDAEAAERFPRAMAFVRPGFDEPEVAAGAPTSLAPFEPRPWQRR